MRLETFQMIDRVVAYAAAYRRLEAEATVPLQSPVFDGHFPGHPLMPGVLLTETMAQASGYLVLALQGFRVMPFLMGVDQARFRQFVGPGARLAITAELDQDGSGYAATKAAIRVEGKLVAQAALRFALQPFPAAMQGAMLSQAERIGLSALLPA